MRKQRKTGNPVSPTNGVSNEKIVIGLALILAVACSNSASALDKVRFRLNWVPGAEFAPFYLGKEKGFFTEEGIDVEIFPGKARPLPLSWSATAPRRWVNPPEM